METLNKRDQIWLKSMHFCRKYCGCHQMESRSFSIKGYQFPLCARCTGIALGHVAGLVLGCCIDVKIYILILMIPMAVDGTVQYFTSYESNNIKRFISGLLYGISFMSFVIHLIRFLIGIFV